MKKEKKKLQYRIFQNIFFLLKGIKEEHPTLILLIAIQIILSVVAPVFGIYIPKIALDLVLNKATLQEIFTVLGTIGIIMALSMGLSGMADSGKYMLYNDMRRYYQQKLFLQSLNCDYKIMESEEGQTKYERAFTTLQWGDMSCTSVMLVSVIDIAVNLLCFCIYSGIMLTLNPLIILLLIALSMISLFCTKRAQNYENAKRDEIAVCNKKIQYVIHAGDSSQFGKDMRLYRTGGWFLSLRNTLIEQSGRITAKIQNRYFAAGAGNACVLFLRDGIAYTYLIYAVLSHIITISEFTLYFGAITAFSGFVSSIVTSLNQLNGANLEMNSLRAFLDNTDEPDPEQPLDPAEIPDYSIEFCDVCFSYNPDSPPVLNHLNLKIEAGEKVALVGVNGIGKTTMVKLLCGFYKPDSGKILIGGKDIRCLQKKDLFTLFSIVFQDIYIPPFTVAENISLQEAKNTDRDRVQSCLIKAGLWEKICQCENGIDTPMTKEITDGLVLSGGEQQKLLMARALYKNAPILILDEPTAALDPIAESQTYEQFHRFAANKTTLYISHRLASTRFCHKIAFLKDGRITEEGTHDELLRKGGDYSKMFQLQSHYYQKGKEDGQNA